MQEVQLVQLDQLPPVDQDQLVQHDVQVDHEAHHVRVVDKDAQPLVDQACPAS